MAELFEITKINGLVLENRFIRSATWEGKASKAGSVTPELTNIMKRLVEGGVGLIIAGIASVTRDGSPGPNHLIVSQNEDLPGLTTMVEEVHNIGGKIVLQIGHAGLFSQSPDRINENLGPSPIKLESGYSCREMNRDEILEVIGGFEKSANIARNADFDGVQIHAAHGYLLSQFLSPFYNKRQDGYGGNATNRARIICEIIRAIRESVGKQYPLLMKLNSEDFIDGGLTIEEMIKAAGLFREAGVDAIELSGGGYPPAKYLPIRLGRLDPKEEGYYKEAARRFKKTLNLPLMLNGGIRSCEVARQLVNEDVADYITFCRPLIREPDLVKRWRLGDKRPSQCISCNLCFRRLKEGKDFRCWAEKQHVEGS
ncbi:MAG: NADH:flavin oxidoreductase [Methanotrichaceae archaeon]|nr:NADH:flavin oxidoreductase [Methanotrichaceae archaeon]